MLYSCLVDADSLDTEKFCPARKNLQSRGKYESFEILNKKFETHMQKINSGAKDSLINRERKNIFEPVRSGRLASSGNFQSDRSNGRREDALLNGICA